MTMYQGGKKQIGKQLDDVMVNIEHIVYGKQLDYFEPFIGMGGVMRHFGTDVNRGSKRYLFACDLNDDIILMWQSLQEGWQPPKKCSETYYNKLKYSKMSSPERGFIGSACSFGGVYFSGYSGKYRDVNSNRDDLKNGQRNIENIMPDMDTVNFLDSNSYDSFSPEGFMIYCDPPYAGTKQYSVGNFDSETFWKHVRRWSKKNLVFVSDETAPNDFVSVWEKKCSRSIVSNTAYEKYVKERLFVHFSIADKIMIQ